MITEERGLMMLAGANPVPQLDLVDVDVEAATYPATLEQRSSEMTQVDKKPTETEKPRQRRVVLVLGAAAVAILIGAVLVLTQREEPAPPANQPTPTTVAVIETPTAAASTLDGYVAAYNGGDIDEVMTFFSEESVITDYPFAATRTGLAQIRALQIQDMAAAASENAYTISNVEVSGNNVTWDHLWVRADGSEWCQVGHSAVIEEGKILVWAWPSSGAVCP